MKYYCNSSNYKIYKLIMRHLDKKEWEFVPTEFWFKEHNVIFYKPKNMLHIDFFPGSVLSKIQVNIPSAILMTDRLKLSKICPKKYSPETYLVTDGVIHSIKNTKRKNIWFLKENHKNFGSGVNIYDNLNDVKKNIDPKKKYVLQKHIKDPLLYKKRKFHIRSYLLIYYTNNTYRFYVYRGGIIVISTEEWKKNNIDKSVQITQTREQNKEFDFDFYKNEYYKKLYYKIKKCMLGVINNYTDKLEDFKNLEKDSFELLGFDIMFDKNLNPYILEVNLGPVIGDFNDDMIKDLTKMIFNSKNKKSGKFTLLEKYLFY